MEFSRRNFLKGGLAAAGALALGGLLPSQELLLPAEEGGTHVGEKQSVSC